MVHVNTERYVVTQQICCLFFKPFSFGFQNMYVFLKFKCFTLQEHVLKLMQCVLYLMYCICIPYILSIDMSEKISNKMTSALLAMSLSYYFVMGEHVEKEMRRTDDILSTLLTWSTDDSYLNITGGRKGNNSL